jgi:hypothetical protein
MYFFGPAAPQPYPSLGFGPFDSHLLAVGIFAWTSVPQIYVSGYQRPSLKILESWWQYTSLDAVYQI